MNTKTLKKLEYNKIIMMLSEKAGSTLGKARCNALLPSCDIDDIRKRQKETNAALGRIFRRSEPSFTGMPDITPSLKRLEIGATLSAGDLLRIASFLNTAGTLKAYGRPETVDDVPDCLDRYFSALAPCTPLKNSLLEKILDEEHIADDASPTLKNIRRKMKSSDARIHETLNRFVSGADSKYLQDSLVTLRGDRYCLPVKSEYKNRIKGLVHDQSATGATLFIEPMAVVKLNNALKELRAQEQEEIEVILSTLSSDAALHTEELKINLEILPHLDLVFAKASLALQMDATMPILNTDGYIHIREGRHPLLPKAKVVPTTITLGDAFDLLIVTGPNTGGKTVSLKTCGLLTLMAQAGLHIPARDRSEIAVFSEIFADIGDEQSIEQSLSTFSSHMTNIVSFLDGVKTNSLVLFDELGAGTDPTEGAALAIAILKHLHDRGIRCMATTHYSELKVFALSTPGVENACCEFDVTTLRPTYRLLIGVPGKSNAFAISRRLGLSENIIESAREHLSAQAESFEDLLVSLEESRRTIEKEEAEIRRYKEDMDALRRRLETQEKRAGEKHDDLIRKAQIEADTILQEAKDVADETIRNFRKYGKNGIDVAAMEKDRARIRREMTRNAPKAKEAPKPTKTYKPSDFQPGTAVKVLSMNVTGHITKKPDAQGFAMVQMGILNSRIALSDMEIIEESGVSYTPKTKSASRTGRVRMAKSLSVSPEINLLGLTVSEATAKLDKYLDDAYLAHINPVRIVHGKGTGALRTGIHKYLKRQKHVKDYHLAKFGEGDAGVTIVTFK